MGSLLRDVSDWEKVDENKGTRRGYWLLPPDRQRRALVKIPEEHLHESGRFIRAEAGAEYLAHLVGHHLGLLVPDVELVWFREGPERYVCSLIRDFCPPGYSLREGADLTGTIVRDRHIPIAEARERLGHYLGLDGATRHLIEMVCFDILIANPDRHQRNWGVLVSASAGEPARMAPYYDNGSGFGSHMTIDAVRKRLFQGWASFDSGFRYEMPVASEQYGRISELLAELKTWDASLAGFVEKLRAFTDDVIGALVEKVPIEAMEHERQEFVRQLLAHRRDLILRQVTGNG